MRRSKALLLLFPSLYQRLSGANLSKSGGLTKSTSKKAGRVASDPSALRRYIPKGGLHEALLHLFAKEELQFGAF